jgi:hypothetical protein
MTKKDYKIIGTALSEYIHGNDEVMGDDIQSRRWEIVMDLMDYLCNALKKDNKKFNENKFKDSVLNI